jgi:Ca-activated chloride channel family protein
VITVRGEQVPVPYDPEAMARIAAESGGKTFTAETGSQLASIYDQIGRDVGFVTQTRELTAAFAGAALLLALLAAAGALVWTQRLA